MSVLMPRRSNDTLRKIEEMADSMQQHSQVVISRHRRDVSRISDGSYVQRPIEVVFRFPGRHAGDAWRFTVTLRLLDLVHEALTAGVVVSKRDIYYRDPALFVTQETVDRYIEDIACTLQVERSALGVTAVPKGLLSGEIVIHYRDGSQHDTSKDNEAILIPDLRIINSIDLSKVLWVLIIEKEATFRSCITSLAPYDRFAGGLLLTAKGYPDQLTKDFVRMLSMPSSLNGYSIHPSYGLVDFDPDGYGIYSCYKQSASSERVEANIRLLGLAFDQTRMSANTPDAFGLHLTHRDRIRARNILKHDPVAQGALRLDLQRMLFLDLKLELQHLSENDGALLGLLRSGIPEWQQS